MLFSILVPVYQVEKYLPECLASIEAQYCQDFEVVLVDDGSKDGSGAMCDAFAQKHPGRVTVIHKENEGLISARRVGIAAAKGEYAIFLDSDDMLDAYCLQILREKLEKYQYPDMVLYQLLYYTNGRIRPTGKAELSPEKLYTGDEKRVLYEGVLNGATINHLGTKAIRMQLLRSDTTDYRPYYGKNMGEDLLQSLYPLTYAKRVLYTNEPLYYYRRNSDGIMRDYRMENMERKNQMHVYRCIQAYLPIWGLDTPEARDMLHARWLEVTMEEMRTCFYMMRTAEERMDVLLFSWKDFVDQSRPVPACLSAKTKHFWELYKLQKYSQLYSEWLPIH